MFGKKQNIDLEVKFNELATQISGLIDIIKSFEKNKTDEFDLIKQNISNFESKIADRLDNFHKEILDKYIKAIESIIQTTKETMLIDTLIKQTSEKDLINLKRAIMQPILEERIKESEKIQGQKIEENIKTKGLEILTEKKRLEEEYLKLNREGKDTKIIEGKLEMMKLIMETV